MSEETYQSLPTLEIAGPNLAALKRQLKKYERIAFWIGMPMVFALFPALNEAVAQANKSITDKWGSFGEHQNMLITGGIYLVYAVICTKVAMMTHGKISDIQRQIACLETQAQMKNGQEIHQLR